MKRYIFITCIFLILPALLIAGVLNDSNVNLPGVYGGSSAWGDFDKDGDMDLLITGEIMGSSGPVRIAYLYRNDDGVFIKVDEFEGVYFGDVAWGDYDNDGDLDFVLTGLNNYDKEVLYVYKNKYPIVGFEKDESQTDLIPVRYSNVAWGDYNNDGLLDLVVIGMNSYGEAITTLYKNTKPGIKNILKQDRTQSLLNVCKGDVVWIDYDKDGDSDLLISGVDGSGLKSAKIFKNDPLGVFTVDKSNTNNLPKLSSCYFVIGDIDADGDPDVLATGWKDGPDGYSRWNAETILLINEPTGVLSEHTLNITNIVGPVAFGDYDNDGDLDFAITGRDEYDNLYGYIYKNDGNNVFSEDKNQNIPKLWNGFISWIDYDLDGDIDLCINGIDDNENRLLKIYSNTEISNSAPSAPSVLNKPVITNDGVLFSWGTGTDDTTPNNLLTYNIRVGSSPGKGDIVSAEIPSGRGNAGAKNNFRLNKQLSKQTYYWAVQTVDVQNKKSEFSQEEQFKVEVFVNSNQIIPDFQQVTQAWADYDNDGDLDMVMAGKDANESIRSILFVNINNTIEENRDIILDGFRYGSFAWGDYNNDGFLDLAFAGNSVRSVKTAGIYDNISGNNLVGSASSSEIIKVDRASLDWGDYDNDGDLDLVIMGNSGTQFITKIYKNENGVISEDKNINLAGYGNGKLFWLDYDNDGDLDLLITGENNPGDNEFVIYNNVSPGVFLKVSDTGIPAFSASTMAYGDYDSDGDFDLVITGMTSSGIEIKVFKNENGSFTEANILPTNATGVIGGAIAFGDYDNDGDLDLIVAGFDGSEQIIKSYNYNNGTYTEEDFKVLEKNGLSFCSLKLVDYDGDGDLDLIAAGQSQATKKAFSSFYDNVEGILHPNNPPDPPAILNSSVNGSSVTLTWSKSSDTDIDPTPSDALTYILRVGTTPGGNDIVSGVYPVMFGKIASARKYIINNLKSKIYYWSVKAIDNGFKQSEWAAEESFRIDTEKPEILNVSITPSAVGISKATVVVNFRENFEMDLTKSPVVKAKMADGLEVNVDQISYDGKTWIGELDIKPDYASGTATISVEDAYDSQGNKMDPVYSAISFLVDTELPTVKPIEPVENQTGVSITTVLKVEFSEEMDPGSINQSVFKLFKDSEEIPGIISALENRRITFSPSDRLESETVYRAVILASVKDKVGNSMGSDYSWTFKTAKIVSAMDGGLLTNEDKTVKVYFSPNSLKSDQEIAINPVLSGISDISSEVKYTGIGIRLGPVDTDIELKKPAVLTLVYDESKLPSGIDINKLTIYRLPLGGIPERIGGSINVQAKKIQVSINVLGTYAIFEDKTVPSVGKGISEITFSPRIFTPKGGGALPSKTMINFKLASPMVITIDIYNSAGRFITRLIEKRSLNQGAQSFEWDGKDGNGNLCPSGLYIVKIHGGNITKIKTVGILNK
ncbi:hypothetical protein DRQ09_00160 [candidate division KSB1 bacterium]|nr:MAG: hypothetical protein DRQ09_00160 [candidate division KSB1 bacterium]